MLGGSKHQFSANRQQPRRRIQETHYIPVDAATGVHFNEPLHWLCQRTGGLDGCVVVAFNLLDEVFREVQWPALLDDREFEFPQMVVLGGCLSLVVRQPSQLVDVWMMKKYWAFQDTIQSGTNTLRPSSHLIVEDGLGDTMKLLQVKVQRVIR